MASRRPTTIAQYIAAAPAAGQPHLRQVYAILKDVAPQAQEAIKWGNPFFVEPRFLFAFSAHKAHLSFAPGAGAMEAFRKELAQHKTTTHMLQVAYTEPVPEVLIRKMARFCVKALRGRQGDGFW